MTIHGQRRDFTFAFLAMVLLHSTMVLAAPALPAPLVEYLYVNSNENQASGGHAAVRIDNDVFHFQFADGLLHMKRDRWPEFQTAYRGYQNRTIYALRLAVEQPTYQALRSAFINRQVTQARQYALLEDTDNDVHILEALRARPAKPLEFSGYGFFDTENSGNATGSSLRSAISQQHGEHYISRRHQQLAQQLSALKPAALVVSAADFVPGSLPQRSYAFNQRYANLVAELHALEILAAGASLNASSLQQASFADGQWTLSNYERRGLRQARAELQAQLVRLIDSPRPDRGQAMLLGMARLEAINLSLAQGRWIFIDTLEGDSDVKEMGPQMRKLLPGLQADARENWLDARQNWRAQSDWNESAYARFEAMNARWLELRRLADGADDWRTRESRQVPKGIGVLDHPPVPSALAGTEAGVDRQMRYTQSRAHAFAADYMGYDVIGDNCVTELFRTIDSAMAELVAGRGIAVNTASLEDETSSRLGETFSPSPIPFVSADQVRRRWRITADRELPSLRRLYIAEQLEENPGPGVLLRESNTLTSRVHQPTDEGSFFIFFTDGNALIRPVLGLANLAAALGASVAGIVQAPFDGGRHLRAGLKGALFSLPELGFQNIRKGTNGRIVPQLRDVRIEAETL